MSMAELGPPSQYETQEGNSQAVKTEAQIAERMLGYFPGLQGWHQES